MEICMRIVLIADQHFGMRNDSIPFLDYNKQFYDDIFFPYIKRNKITKIVDLGDTFDRRKYVNINTLKRVNDFYFKKIEDMNLHLDILLGNHTTYFKNTNEVNTLKSIYGKYKNIKIYTDPTYVKFGGTEVLMVPWINSENQEQSLKMIAEQKANVIMGHLEIQGFYYYRGAKCETGFDKKIFSQYDKVLSGHFHHRHDDGTIFYLGSPYEMTYADLNDPKGFHVLDTDKLTLKFIQNPYKMFHKIYYDDRNKTLEELVGKSKLNKFTGTYIKVIVSHKTNPYIYDQFLEKLYQVVPHNISIVENFIIDDSEGGMDLSQDTLTILQNYVNQIDTNGLDKDKMKDILRNLYIEANSMEVTTI